MAKPTQPRDRAPEVDLIVPGCHLPRSRHARLSFCLPPSLPIRSSERQLDRLQLNRPRIHRWRTDRSRLVRMQWDGLQWGRLPSSGISCLGALAAPIAHAASRLSLPGSRSPWSQPAGAPASGIRLLGIQLPGIRLLVTQLRSGRARGFRVQARRWQSFRRPRACGAATHRVVTQRTCMRGARETNYLHPEPLGRRFGAPHCHRDICS
jgi:hypothetical protein